MIIPEQLQGLNFVLIGKYDNGVMTYGDGKIPAEKGWQKKIHKIDCPTLQEHIEDGYNYGVQPNDSFIEIDGENRFLIVIDFDTREFQDKIINNFPETFTTTSGSKKNCVHLWLASDNNKAFKIKDEKLTTLSDVIGSGNQVIAPGSKHHSGSTYSVVKDIPIAFMPYSEIEALMRPHDKRPKKAKKPTKQYSPKGMSSSIAGEIINSVSMEDILDKIGIETQQNPTNCFGHDSNGGKCFSWSSDLCHCFNCDKSWNKFSLIRDAKNLSDKETFDWFAEKTGRTEELKKSRKEYVKESEFESAIKVFTIDGQTEMFFNKQPFFYDKSKNFFLWNKKEFKWEISDEVDILNAIYQITGKDIITSKSRCEIVNALKQRGRLNTPEPIKKSWVQFKKKIYDVENGTEFDASPKYFVTNPIPWDVGDSEDTPTIDKYLEQWVGLEYKQNLYELMAYNICSDKFMQRIFALCGGGANGKGTFIKLNYKFLGDENCVSSEIKAISEDKFETAVLYKKLLCVMGEVSHSDLKNTNQIKKIAGEDKMSFQFKGHTPFTDDNITTCVCLTNSLPRTPDKSLGFYRKWQIIDFPNQFNGIKNDIIKSIPEVEFNNLGRKCLRILKNLYGTMKFSNEGDFDKRMKRYEDRSNPVMRFLEEHYEENPGEFMALRDFTNDCNDYLKARHLRIISPIQVGKILREEGFGVGPRKINDVSSIVILNIRPKKLLELPKLAKSSLETHREASENSTSSTSSSSSESNNDAFDTNLYKGLSKQEMKLIKTKMKERSQ